jgi:ribosome modulation factor
MDWKVLGRKRSWSFPAPQHTYWGAGGEEVGLQLLLIHDSAIDGVSGQSQGLAAFTPGKMTPGSKWIGGWVGHRADPETEATGKSYLPPPGIEGRSPGSPERSQTLYWLSYTRSFINSRMADAQTSVEADQLVPVSVRRWEILCADTLSKTNDC